MIKRTHSVDSLQNALFLGFCAVLIVAAKLFFRWHLNISGHSMFFIAFFLLLAKAVVPKRWAASTVGLWAGLMVVVLGLGKGGPLQLTKYLFPALAVDFGGTLVPRWAGSVWGCALLGLAAGAGKFLANVFIDWLVGMDMGVLLLHATIKAVGGLFFAVLGSLLVPPVLKRLRAHGLLPVFK